MVPSEVFVREKSQSKDGEYGQRYDLLDNLKLDEVKWSAIINKSYTVGWDLAAVFEESYAPRDYDDTEHTPLLHNREVAEP